MSTNIDREALRREGWQVIETPGEKLDAGPKRKGDEYLDKTRGTWHAADALDFCPGITYRRRIPASGWISTKDRLPTEADLPIACGVNGRVCIMIRPGDECIDVFLRPYTHWFCIPPLPEPVKPTQEQLDNEEADAWVKHEASKNAWDGDQIANARDAYLAGLRAERARGGKGRYE